MNNFLSVVALIGAVLIGAANCKNAQTGATALVQCVRQNPGAVSQSFRLAENADEGQCYARCLMQALDVVTNSGVNWNHLENLLTSEATATLNECKGQHDVGDGSSCSLVHQLYKCVGKNHAKDLQAAYHKNFNTNAEDIQAAIKSMLTPDLKFRN